MFWTPYECAMKYGHWICYLDLCSYSLETLEDIYDVYFPVWILWVLLWCHINVQQYLTESQWWCFIYDKYLHFVNISNSWFMLQIIRNGNFGHLLSHDKWFILQIDSINSSQTMFKTGDSVSAICTNCNVISLKINCYFPVLKNNLYGGSPSIIGFSKTYKSSATYIEYTARG